MAKRQRQFRRVGGLKLADFPEIAAEFHADNGLRPEKIAAGSGRKFKWSCTRGHVWIAPVKNRTALGLGCKVCSGRRPSAETNLLADFPAIAAEWHPDKNGRTSPDAVTRGSHFVAHWICGKGHAWAAPVYKRTGRGDGCAVCSGRQVADDRSLASEFPNIAAQWHPELNGTDRPWDAAPRSGVHVWWRCELGHSWRSSISNRTGPKRPGCPTCAGQRATSQQNLALANAALAAEWHPLKNVPLGPSDVLPQSNRIVWWQCVRRHEWEASIANRTRGRSCQLCSGRVPTTEQSFAIDYPELAIEWDHASNDGLLPEDFVSGSRHRAAWRCEQGHSWATTISHRTRRGQGCPKCAVSGTSRIEQLMRRALHETFGFEPEEALVQTNLRPNPWKVDAVHRGAGIAVEFDGSYWHGLAGARERDQRKTADLEHDGWLVIRVRDQLPAIGPSDLVVSAPVDNGAMVSAVLSHVAAALSPRAAVLSGSFDV